MDGATAVPRTVLRSYPGRRTRLLPPVLPGRSGRTSARQAARRRTRGESLGRSTFYETQLSRGPIELSTEHSHKGKIVEVKKDQTAAHASIDVGSLQRHLERGAPAGLPRASESPFSSTAFLAILAISIRI